MRSVKIKVISATILVVALLASLCISSFALSSVPVSAEQYVKHQIAGNSISSFNKYVVQYYTYKNNSFYTYSDSLSLPNLSREHYDFALNGFSLSENFNVKSYINQPFTSHTVTGDDYCTAVVSRSFETSEFTEITGRSLAYIDFCVSFGVQTTSYYDPTFSYLQYLQIKLYGSNISSLGHFEVLERSDRIYYETDVNEVSNGTVHENVPFYLSAVKYRFIFDEPLDLNNFISIHKKDDLDISKGLYISCYSDVRYIPYNYLRTFSAFSYFDVAYVNQADLSNYLNAIKEQNTIDGNKNTINDIKGKVESMPDVPTPNDNDVDNVLSNIGGDSINDIGFNNPLGESSIFTKFVLAVAVPSLSIAFIGYVLHGKRG